MCARVCRGDAGGALQGMAAEVAALHASTAELRAGKFNGAAMLVAQAALIDRTAALKAALEAAGGAGRQRAVAAPLPHRPRGGGGRG